MRHKLQPVDALEQSMQQMHRNGSVEDFFRSDRVKKYQNRLGERMEKVFSIIEMSGDLVIDDPSPPFEDEFLPSSDLELIKTKSDDEKMPYHRLGSEDDEDFGKPYFNLSTKTLIADKEKLPFKEGETFSESARSLYYHIPVNKIALVQAIGAAAFFIRDVTQISELCLVKREWHQPEGGVETEYSMEQITSFEGQGECPWGDGDIEDAIEESIFVNTTSAYRSILIDRDELAKGELKDTEYQAEGLGDFLGGSGILEDFDLPRLQSAYWDAAVRADSMPARRILKAFEIPRLEKFAKKAARTTA